ncbi:MAG TPA: hypothetical protein VIV60_03795 [Polyangiaceae bacterium]
MPRPLALSMVLTWFATSLSITGAAAASPVVRAELEWQGRCENRSRLRAELLERGVELVRVSDARDGGERIKLLVSAEWGGVTSRPIVVATLALDGNAGGHEQRVVEASDCDGLQSAIAVILTVFAQQTLPAPTLAVVEQAPFTTPTQPPMATPVEPLRDVERAPKRSALLLSGTVAPTASSKDTSKPRYRAGELRLGTALKSSYGWVDAATVGPSLHVQWRPARHSSVALLAAVSSLTTLDLRSHDTPIAVGRRDAMLAAKFDTPFSPLKTVLGIELGRLSVSASELRGDRGDRATWFALLLMPELEVPLYDRILIAQLGTGLAFAPTRYQFRYQDTEGILTETHRFDWRAEVGLSVLLSPKFP